MYKYVDTPVNSTLCVHCECVVSTRTAGPCGDLRDYR